MSASEPNIHSDIGRRVRATRTSLGWTLDDLAATSGVSRRMIINVEGGSVNASIGTLLRLSDALGIGIPSLVAPERVTTVSLTPTGKGTALWRSPGGGQAVLLAGTAPPDVLELWEWTLAPGDRHASEAHSAGTREIARVEEGAVQIETADGIVDLATGDTLVLNGDVDHAYMNPGATPARFTLVVFEPNVRSSERDTHA